MWEYHSVVLLYTSLKLNNFVILGRKRQDGGLLLLCEYKHNPVNLNLKLSIYDNFRKLVIPQVIAPECVSNILFPKQLLKTSLFQDNIFK